MDKFGGIIIIDDDEDDQFLLKEAFCGLDYKNELLFFPDGLKALDYLDQIHTVPFLILSDINMPKIDGFELRDRLRDSIRPEIRCVPFIFFSTAASKQMLLDAYSSSIQGVFIKKSSLTEIEKMISVIMDYWSLCAFI